MHKKIMVAFAAAVAAAAFVPAVASAATSVPDLPTNLTLPVHQAYLADDEGNPEHATVNVEGPLTLNSSTGLVIGCANTATVTINDDGTSEVTAFVPAGCTTNVPGCTASIAATNLNWGDRLGYDTNSSSFKDYINVAFNVTLGAGCPVSGTFTETGILSPTVAVSGGVLTATFSGAASGSVTGPIGSATVSGTLTSTSGVSAGTQLIY